MEIELPFTYRPMILMDDSWLGKREYLAGYEILYNGDVVYTVRQNKEWAEKYVKMMNFGYKMGFGNGYVKAKEKYNEKKEKEDGQE